MYESCEKYNSEGSAVVFDEDSNDVLEEGAVSNNPAEVADNKNEESNWDGKVKCGIGTLPGENLDTFLEVDEGNIEAKDVAWKTSHIFEGVAGVGDGENPVHKERPSEGSLATPTLIESGNLQSNQGHETKIICASGGHYIVDSAVIPSISLFD